MVQPEKRFQVGNCTASVFENEVQTQDGKKAIKNVSFQKTYRDKKGNFQHTNSLQANEIPKAILALAKAYDYLVAKESK